MEKTDIEHLKWLYGRLKHAHNENENYDYMVKFREIIGKLSKTINSNETFAHSPNRVDMLPDDVNLIFKIKFEDV